MPLQDAGNNDSPQLLFFVTLRFVFSLSLPIPVPLLHKGLRSSKKSNKSNNKGNTSNNSGNNAFVYTFLFYYVLYPYTTSWIMDLPNFLFCSS